MKKTLIFIVAAFISLSGYAQKYSIIKGKVNNEKLKTITLYQTVDGSLQKYAETQVAKDGSYGFVITPDVPGFYTIGDKRMNFIFYLQGGEEVNMDLFENNAELNGKNTKENIALYKWENYAANIRLKSVFFERTPSNYEDFFPDFKKFLTGKEKIRKGLKSGNKEFDTILQQLMDYETDYYAIMLLFTPRDKHPEPFMYPEYYKHIVSDDKFTDNAILQFPEGVNMMNAYCNYLQIQNPTEGISYTDASLAYLHTDKLKGVFVVNNEFLRYKSYDRYLSAMEKYGKYLVTPSLKAKAEAVGTKLYDTRAGGVAADFTYPDVNGKMVSLSDFKNIPFDFICADLSFISLEKVIKKLLSLLKPDGMLVCLVKPQFETSPEIMRKNKGVLKDERLQHAALEKIENYIKAGCPDSRIVGTMPSPIRGGDGNMEYLIGIRK